MLNQLVPVQSPRIPSDLPRSSQEPVEESEHDRSSQCQWPPWCMSGLDKMTDFLAKDFSVLRRTELNTLSFHAGRASPTFAAKLGSVWAHLATRPLWALYRVAMKAPCVSIGHWKGNQIAREDTTRLRSCITLDITWLGSRLFLWKVSFFMLFASPNHACKNMACSKQQQRSKQFLCHTSARGSGYNHCIFHLSYPPGQNQSSFVFKHLDLIYVDFLEEVSTNPLL